MIKLLTRILALALVACIASAAGAATITGQNVNCRSTPNTRGKIVHRFRAGDEVSVSKRTGVWLRVTPPAAGCWVASDYVGDASANSYHPSPAGSRMSAAAGHRSVSKPNHWWRQPMFRHAARRPSRRSSVYDGGGSCPCRGRNICIGPRGGRYCITSGGNKRYGV